MKYGIHQTENKTVKIFILFLILTTSTFKVIAAEDDDKGLQLGVKAAPSLAWFRSDTQGFASNGSIFGFSYGLILENKFGKRYSFMTGIDVTYRGGKLISDTKSGDTTFKSTSSYNLQYIEVPVTLKFRTNEIGYLTYFLQVGLTPGFNIRARQDFETTSQLPGGSPHTTSEKNKDYQPNINNVNLSMVIGAGVEYTLSGSTVLQFGLQFNNGFLDVFDNEAKVNSNFLALTLGVLF